MTKRVGHRILDQRMFTSTWSSVIDPRFRETRDPSENGSEGPEIILSKRINILDVEINSAYSDHELEKHLTRQLVGHIYVCIQELLY